ncbi:MAG TPA: hypothetical protein VKU40_11540 [Thermoanaerobaculia bacterium]|nr:hypothetical protein [Thermoanaerobaculia bacterium]
MNATPPRRSTSRISRRRGPLATVAALVAILALLAGTVGFHADGGDHAVVASPLAQTTTTIEACAPGHTQNRHYEKLRKAERHECTACIHRLLHHADTGTTRAPTALVAAGTAPTAPVSDLTQAPLDRSPSRGPPTA